MWRRTKDIVLVLTAITLLSSSALADISTPEGLAAKISALAKKGDWASYANLMHPEALSSLKKIFRPIAKADESGQVLRLLFGVQSLDHYDSMADKAIFQALMSNLTKNFPGFADVMQSHETDIIGSVPEGNDLVHVVYRLGAKTEGMTISKTSVITFRQHNGQWRALLTGNIEGLAARLSQIPRRRSPNR